MTFFEHFIKKFLIGIAHGLGIATGIGVVALVGFLFKSELKTVITRVSSPITVAASTVDIASYQQAEKRLNPHESLISGKSQISVPQGYDKQYVSSSEQLLEVFGHTKGNVAIYLAPGTYNFTKALTFDKPNIMLLSEYADKESVILNGRGMVRSHKVENLIDIKSSGAVIDGITMQNAGNHIIQIRSERDADFPIIRNCTIRDGYEQLLKVSYDKRNRPEEQSDSGIIENCLFEYSAGIGPNHYIGGIDAHGIRNWVIKGNVFKHIASPGNRIAEHAIHLWNNTENNIVENNIIIDSDRAIGFGMRKRAKGDENKNIKFSNYGGIIRNNFIYHSDNQDPFADTGIILEDSPNTLVENNAIFMEHAYRRAIEYRFAPTQGVMIKNNRTNKRISSRDGGSADEAGNSEALTKAEFLVKLHEFSVAQGISFTY
ncbi:hypothetical protein D210916BOD24_07980 [Alteromonas sp. D210916BOD_24]|uniref:right-handed parallel beta-helix repeat-containing protein n=1 Tax=Alteromonas sp. D210916BOD_24 TaxID=3157618 RepID=UPI00399C7B8D